MKSYKVKYSKLSKKFLKSHKIEGIKFFKAFEEIAVDVSNVEKYDVKNLVGKKDLKRLRIGKYRAVFRIVNDILEILVLDIDSRGEIYKNL